tara:strand:+ start:84 stop:2492 length:2409 start_codon:yes stop_codon:yes gene_type:complete
MAKNYKKYASGGRFNASNISRAGIQQMQNQSQIVTNALQRQANQQKSADNLYIKDLGGKLKREAQNRADIQDLENKVLQRQQEATALRGQREVEALKSQANQYRDQAQMIGQLAPKLSKSLIGLAQNVTEYADIQSAEAEYREMQADGRLDTLVDFWNSTDNLEQQAREDLVQKRVQAIATNDRTTFDYLSAVGRNNSKHLQRKIFQNLTTNFSSIENDFLNFVRDEAGIQLGNNVKELYSFRAHEFLRQYGISTKSPTGIKVIQLFDSKAAVKEYEFKLERDKLNGEQDEQNNTDNLRNVWNQPLGNNYTSDNQYQDAQTFLKNIIVDKMGTPGVTRSGTLAASTTINPLPSFREWAKAQAFSPRYRSNPDLFRREVLGQANGQNGYILPTTQGNEKGIPIFDKLEYLEAEMMRDYADVTKELNKADVVVQKAKEAGEAKEAQAHVDSDRYDQDFTQIYKDIEATKSPAAKKVYYNHIQFHSADGLSQNTVDHVLKAAQQADFSQFIFRYNKLSKEDKDGAVLLPFKKTMDALEQIAGSYDAIETKIKEDVKSKITAAVKENMIDQTRHDTATQASEAAELWFYNKYRANSKIEDPNERYITTLEQLEEQLGIGENPDGGIVGKGLFRNRPGGTGENKTVFIMFSDADAKGDTIGQSIINSEIEKGTSVPALLSRKDLVSNGETRLLAEAAIRGTDNIVLPKNLQYVLNNYYPKGTNAHHIVNQFLGLQKYKINMPASAHDFAEYVSGGSVTYNNMAAALTKQYIENSGYSRQPVKPSWMTLANPIYQDLLRRQYPEYYNE